MVIFWFLFFAVVGLLAVCGGLFFIYFVVEQQNNKVGGGPQGKKRGKKGCAYLKGSEQHIESHCCCWLSTVVDGSRWPLRRS
jgi:hypothetical protein